MYFRQIEDRKLAQYAYLIGCQRTKEAILIDPQRDIDRYISLAEREGLNIVAVADTHIHADYLSGCREFAERGVRVYASDEGDADWKFEWLLGSSYSYQLLKDGDTFRIGNIELKAVHTPGHTPEHICFLVTDFGGGADSPMGLVSGDFVFVGDLGRPDLLESAAGVEGVMVPSARQLYGSVQRFLELEDHLQIWPGHGAGSACGKALGAIPETTVGYERRFNGAIQAALRGEDEFVDAILDGQPEPPMYFARMKRDNKTGPTVLGDLPNPRLLSLAEFGALSARDDVVVVDTRNRDAFLAGHLPGSLAAPFNKTFNTVAGSYIEELSEIYLVIEEEHVHEAVVDLIRIGLDDIAGYATPGMVDLYRADGGGLASIPRKHMDDIPELRAQDGVAILDVRNATEWTAARVPDSMNIAYPRLYVRRDEVPTSQTLAVHCLSGGRSLVAAALLKRLGHDVIFLDGNFQEWASSYETASGPPAAALV